MLSGLLPAAEAGVIVRRVLPLLIFLGSVFMLAELTAKGEVFDVLASRLARMAQGITPLCSDVRCFRLGYDHFSEPGHYCGLTYSLR